MSSIQLFQAISHTKRNFLLVPEPFRVDKPLFRGPLAHSESSWDSTPALSLASNLSLEFHQRPVSHIPGCCEMYVVLWDGTGWNGTGWGGVGWDAMGYIPLHSHLCAYLSVRPSVCLPVCACLFGSCRVCARVGVSGVEE